MAKPHRICAVDGCGKNVEKRDWCGTHYQRWRLHGDPLALKRVPNGTCLRWLRDHVDHEGDDCLAWPFSRKETGYAQINYEGHPQHAHRLMCTLAHGPAPADNMDAAHTCGRGAEGCLNPKHLAWKTRSENMLDKGIHGTNPRGEDTSGSVLTEDLVLEIVATADRMSERALARRFGVHRSTINHILSGRNWAWLTGIKEAV